MPRALRPGSYGDIHVIDLPDGRHKARARFRDFDGRVRLISRTADSPRNAADDLRAALVERRGAGGDEVSSNTRLDALADLWLEQPHGWSTGTARTYGYIGGANVKPALGQLRTGEVTPAVIRALPTESRMLRERREAGVRRKSPRRAS